MKQSLSPERIELAALDLIERESLAAFSTRKLAAELHCEAMSIYHYFPSKGHLMDALVDRVMGTEVSVLEPTGLDWRGRIEGVARELRALAHRRPHFFGYLAMHRMNTPRALRGLNGIIGVFENVGIGEEAGVRMFRAFSYYVIGALLDETAGYARGPSTVEPIPDDEMQAQYPHVAAAGRWFRQDQWKATFELGLKVFLDGLDRMVAEAGNRVAATSSAA
jgi:AcrR family transcriptional regulator